MTVTFKTVPPRSDTDGICRLDAVVDVSAAVCVSVSSLSADRQLSRRLKHVLSVGFADPDNTPARPG